MSSETFFSSMLSMGIAENQEANNSNKRKIQEAIDKYWDACKYPRKKKKKIRKEAQKEYDFWVSIDKWYQKEFGFFKI